MIFDLFHSVSDPVVNGRSLGAKKSIENYLDQVFLAESLGMDTAWLAESHFSSETQKKTSVATIQNFFGEVGLNCDSFQFLSLLIAKTKRIHLGTGIHNIVGGSGGPISSAERVNFLHFLNQSIWQNGTTDRELKIGFASGRFPYQNTPFGFVPRDSMEKDLWDSIKPKIFLEALEIFVRLLKGEELSSETVSTQLLSAADVKSAELRAKYEFPIKLKARWNFESLKLIPEKQSPKGLRLVLGSGDPAALELAYRHWPVDLFNLSFTPPEQIEKLHIKMSELNKKFDMPWKRERLPRTVLVFIDPDPKKALEHANFVLDTYVEAMRGTAMVPNKEVLLQRALVGDAAQIREQLHPENVRGFQKDDRLMLWFEFNQLDNELIKKQMRYFFDEVVAKI